MFLWTSSRTPGEEFELCGVNNTFAIDLSGLFGSKGSFSKTSNPAPKIIFEFIALIKSNSNPKIIPHMYGIPVDVSQINNEYVIEDCSHAVGAKINNQSVGTFGEIGIFSFFVTKLMTTGGFGGMLVSKSFEKLFENVSTDWNFSKSRKFRGLQNSSYSWPYFGR